MMNLARRLLVVSLLFLLSAGAAGLAAAQFLSGVATAAGVTGSCATVNGVAAFTSATVLGCSGVVGTGGALSSITTIGMSGQLTSTLATGSAPFVIASTTRVANLNVATAGAVDGLSVAGGKTLTASNTLTFTGTDASSVALGTGGTVAYTANKLSAFAATTSAELAGVISDETGSGALVFAGTPTLVTPVLGVATHTSLTGPLVVGGSAADSTLTLQSTSGVGTTDAISLKVGNNGAVTGLSLNTTGDATFGASATITTRTGTPAAYACFDSGGKLVESATPCV